MVMARPVDTSDARVQWVLKALRDHPDCTMAELWFLDLQNRFSGYQGPGSFNFGYVERVMPRLREQGYLVKGEKHRLRITSKGLAMIKPTT